MFCSKCNIYLEKQPTFLTHRRRPFDALAGLGGVSRLESECGTWRPTLFQDVTFVADGQFSTLGTVLLGTLARLTNAIGLDKELKSPAQTVTFKATPSHPTIEGSEDFGEVLSRNKNLSCPDEILEEASSKAEENFKSASTRPESKIDEAVTTHNKKKKKKKKDAIDSLFDGLL
ncbi:hypothetical protein ETB97_012903 [Aspergillus alliaceus]|uniref:Uncharacterized protein n=1 Tax=Petromyces alliaceus TaxID=209559 RepID=A0A8H6A7A7_PETAA|nr:hypothetical protein ETB97_012903 [Aspergillus burnettii]